MIAAGSLAATPGLAQVYTNTFSPDAGGFTGGTVVQTPNQVQTFLMLGSGVTSTLTVTGLTAFTSGTLSFNLYAINSEDGNGNQSVGGGSGGGRDNFTVTGPGGLSFTTNIANYPGNTQAFPNATGMAGSENDPNTGALSFNQFGYTPCCNGQTIADSEYFVTLPFVVASSTSFTFTFTDGSSEGTNNEFYGIDNVSVVTNGGVPVPGPIAGAGLFPLFGLAGGWYARRRKLKPAA